jgi:hypothetical protein
MDQHTQVILLTERLVAKVLEPGNVECITKVIGIKVNVMDMENAHMVEKTILIYITKANGSPICVTDRVSLGLRTEVL